MRWWPATRKVLELGGDEDNRKPSESLELAFLDEGADRHAMADQSGGAEIFG